MIRIPESVGWMIVGCLFTCCVFVACRIAQVWIAERRPENQIEFINEPTVPPGEFR